MGIVRKSVAEVRARTAEIDRLKVASLSDADSDRFANEDDSDTSTLGVPELVPPRVNVKELREKLGMSRVEFADRYYIPLRTLQEWEQNRREPADAARAYLFAISQTPDVIAQALRRPAGA